MRHYFIVHDGFNIRLNQYLKQKGKTKHYDSIKHKLTRKYSDKDGDILIPVDSEFLAICQVKPRGVGNKELVNVASELSIE